MAVLEKRFDPLAFRLTLLVLALNAAGASAADKPLKVFILAGQSNMQGHASVSTFDSLADDPKTAPLLKEMRDKDGKPTVCEKVWITSVGCLGDAYSDLNEKKGKLTAGFGAPENKIGPEFTFGLTMEKLLGEPVLIIKTAWGGRSLHTDFRPPSAGPYEWSEFELGPVQAAGRRPGEGKGREGEGHRRVLPRDDRTRAEGAQGHQAGGAGLRSESRGTSWPGSSGSRGSTTWYRTGPTTSR